MLTTGGRLQVRVGIATGLVVVGDLIGEGARRSEAVVGETPNLAARLQALAEPNTVVIAEARAGCSAISSSSKTLAPRTSRASLDRRGPGRRCGRVPSRAASRHCTASRLTALVGRDEELELLLRRWSRAKAGDGQVVLISGEAGSANRDSRPAFSSALPPNHTRGCAISARRSTRTARFTRSSTR